MCDKAKRGTDGQGVEDDKADDSIPRSRKLVGNDPIALKGNETGILKGHKFQRLGRRKEWGVVL